MPDVQISLLVSLLPLLSLINMHYNNWKEITTIFKSNVQKSSNSKLLFDFLLNWRENLQSKPNLAHESSKITFIVKRETRNNVRMKCEKKSQEEMNEIREEMNDLPLLHGMMRTKIQKRNSLSLSTRTTLDFEQRKIRIYKKTSGKLRSEQHKNEMKSQIRIKQIFSETESTIWECSKYLANFSVTEDRNALSTNTKNANTNNQ